VPSVCDKRDELPCELDPVFERALAKEPHARFDTASEFVAALRQALDDAAGQTGPIAPVVPTAETRVRRAPPPAPPRRSRSWLAPLLGGVLLAAVVGAIIGAVVATRGHKNAAQAVTITHVVTHEGPGTTAVSTQVTTAQAPTTATTAAAPPSGGSPHAMTDQATDLMRRGSYDQAASLAEQAARALAGSGPADPYEAFANYDAGYSLYRLGRCSEAVPYLEKARQLEPQRVEPRTYLLRAQHC
jgi:tetratricopeptide (TPR) repeat protein